MRAMSVAIVVAAYAVSLVVASPARADANDQSFLDQLGANGLSCGQTVIECPSGDDSMIAIGHAICRQLRGGNSARSVGTQIVRSRPGMQPDQAVMLVVSAKTAYCP